MKILINIVEMQIKCNVLKCWKTIKN